MSFLHDWSQAYPDLLHGLGISLQVTAGALLIGYPIGLLLALGSMSHNRVIRVTAVTLVELGRGTPALVVLQLVYFGLPSSGLTLSALASAVAALALTTAAYASEIIRGGLQAVPAGEIEAAQAIALHPRDTLRYVVIPQGLRVCMPPLLGLGILIFQASALAYTIAVPELLSRAYAIGSSNFKYLSVLALAGLLYAAIAVPASWLTTLAERRLSRHL